MSIQEFIKKVIRYRELRDKRIANEFIQSDMNELYLLEREVLPIDVVGVFLDEINTLTAKVKRYEEVLKYYSNIENFNFVQTDQDNIYLCEGINENEPLKNHPSEYDQLGKRARAALGIRPE